MKTKYVRYIINVLEPKHQYLLDFVDMSLKGCQSQAESYLSQCPTGTDYMHVQTAYTTQLKCKYAPKKHPTSNVVINIGDLQNEN